MIDAILYASIISTLPDGMALANPSASSGTARLHYVRVSPSRLDELSAHYTVLAQSQYTGTGTADRVYQQIKDDPEKLTIYESVRDLSPREVPDGEGGTRTVTPSFSFGKLAESTIPVPASVASRQGMQQLIIAGLDDQVDAAIDAIADPVERKLTRAWFERATDWERENAQLISMAQALGLTEQQIDDYMRAAALL